ncbi:MAG: DNA recombination protein RmuC [Gammaproteobacteria bacterium]
MEISLTQETILYVAGGFLAGALITWLLFRSKITDMNREVTRLGEKLAVETDRVVQRESRMDELKRDLDRFKSQNEGQQSQIESYKVSIAELNTTLEQERKQAEEKLALLQQAEKKMTDAFEVLSNRILEEKSKKFTDQNKNHLGEILNPLREQLGDFRKKIEDVYDKETKDRVSLYHEITSLKKLNEKMSQDAINLTNALKGESKTRGDWGEVILEKVLEQSGLTKGREYEVQGNYKDSNNKLFRPDVVVHLPNKRDVVIDSKVSLVAYERYYSAAEEPEKMQALKEHVNSLRTHVSGLKNKSYDELVGVNSLDMVLMFVPIEPALMLAFEQDDVLFQDAFQNGIFLVSPSTLSMNLQIIQNMWRHEYQNQNAQEIASSAGDLYDKFVNFVASLEDIGDKLDKARASYDVAHGRLTSGRGNLVKKVQDLQQLGSLKTRKQLSKDLLIKSNALPDDMADEDA